MSDYGEGIGPVEAFARVAKENAELRVALVEAERQRDNARNARQQLHRVIDQISAARDEHAANLREANDRIIDMDLKLDAALVNRDEWMRAAIAAGYEEKIEQPDLFGES